MLHVLLDQAQFASGSLHIIPSLLSTLPSAEPRPLFHINGNFQELFHFPTSFQSVCVWRSLITSPLFCPLCVCAAVAFTEEEKEQLRRFSNRSYLLDRTEHQRAWLSLLDLLLAYCYEVRSTEGELSVSDCPWKQGSTSEQHLAMDDKALCPQILHPPPPISFRALRDYGQIPELSSNRCVSPRLVSCG